MSTTNVDPHDYLPTQWTPFTYIANDNNNKAVLCPVCNGKGQVNNVHAGDTCAERWEICHGCNGKGWVIV